MVLSFGHEGFSIALRCNQPVRVTSYEEAETLLRIHHHCSSDVCCARRSARAFLDSVTGRRSDESDRPERSDHPVGE